VQTDHPGPVGVVEMTADRIAHGGAQGFEIIGLGEDRIAKSARRSRLPALPRPRK
jgi:hypothetical protein